MNYFEWSQEYLQEAEKIKEKVACIKKEMKSYKGNNARELNRRLTIMYSMYLECRHTGTYLLNKATKAGERCA